MKKILILGAGYVGQKMKEYFGERALLVNEKFYTLEALEAILSSHEPCIVVNAMGKTGSPNVDWCEDHREETFFSNVTLPLMIAELCQKYGHFMVHIGSGCIYSHLPESYAFAEDDEPNFAGSFYSKTKHWSERALKHYPVLQLRLRMPFDSQPHPRNFMTKIAAYPKVISVPNSISVLEDFFQATESLINREVTGVFNMTNPGAVDHEWILARYRELVDPQHAYELIPLEALETKAGRSNCELSAQKLADYGITMRPVQEAIEENLKIYAGYFS